MTFSRFRPSRLSLFLTGLVAALMFTPGREAESFLLQAVIWFGTCLLAEALWHPARDGVSHLSAAPAARLAALVSAPPILSLPAAVLSAGVGELLWRRGGFREALSSAGVALFTSAPALGLILLLHAPSFHEPGVESALGDTVRHVAGLAAAGILLVALGQVMETVRASRVRGLPFRAAWKEAFGGENEFWTLFALLAVALIAHGCYTVLGYRGLLLCAMPALFVLDGSRRYVELRRAQERLLNNERLAAKGDMAAEIGHELNNYLSAILGRAQLLARAGRGEASALRTEVTGIEEVSRRMADLSRGLVDFAHRGSRASNQEINDIVERTVNFVRPQPRFRGVEFQFLPGANIPHVGMDPGLVQQALLSILAMLVGGDRRAEPIPLAIHTFSRARSGTVGIEIRLGPAAAGRTSESGIHDVGRLLARHQGKLELARNEESGGEIYRFLLPAA